ncbi:response regulator [Dechloromonas sp. ZY10]|uniref:response regulator n=1 Tax=Dechloromonas aquae TaxID=2664436 RepID=UPI0035290558
MSVDFSKKRFLVVDDQPMAREALRTIAQSAGAFAVEFAVGYQDALYRIRNNPPDVILCDYMLGKDRSGQQLLEEVRRFNLLTDEAIFIMVTGEQAYEQVVSAVELAPDEYIIKPFSPDKLLFRLERVAARKEFFSPYYRLRRNGDYPGALTTLGQLAKNEEGRQYRYEIMRQQAETMLAGGNATAAETAYRAILENYQFPWAQAGVARSLHHQQRTSEAREEIERVVAGAPHFFDAADLKAQICMAQGDHAEAQRVLDDVARRTPRNYLRKRLLAEAATLNGDVETARTAMADVIENDTMPGAITLPDQLALVRSYLAANDPINAEKILYTIKESDLLYSELGIQASYYALLTLTLPSKGKPKLAGLRPALMATPFDAATHLDLLHAALSVGDDLLADTQATHLLSSHDAKKVFATLRKYYALYGREADLRNLQREVALQRIRVRDSQAEPGEAAIATPDAT